MNFRSFRIFCFYFWLIQLNTNLFYSNYLFMKFQLWNFSFHVDVVFFVIVWFNIYIFTFGGNDLFISFALTTRTKWHSTTFFFLTKGLTLCFENTVVTLSEGMKMKPREVTRYKIDSITVVLQPLDRNKKCFVISGNCWRTE